MADTDECAERAYFWIALVIVMHSDITREIGSTATVTGRLRYCMREDCAARRVGGTSAAKRTIESVTVTSRLILPNEVVGELQISGLSMPSVDAAIGVL
jgi:hypothetical protein